MTTDLAVQIVDEATASVRAGQPFQAVFDRVVALASEGLPSPAWDAIGSVDLAADVQRTTTWLLRQLDDRPPPEDLSALWFGLHEVRGPGPGRAEAVIAVSGGPGFPDPEWLKKKNWDPPGYVPAAGLRSMLPLSVPGGSEVRHLVGSAIVLSYGLGFTAAVVDGLDPARLLGGRPELGIATGFSDGNVALVGILTSSGLDRSRLAEA